MVTDLHERLREEGVPAHPRRFRHHAINAHQARILLGAGLREAEIDAIRLEGLSIDELNSLLVRGSRL